ncbi:MAG TPA: beta-galactosidase trimerization domain-containing protein, partial [Propionibacteriaceae bacterium]|nr:beta-galactosidase trimerization domain-containing protein [Propionibacteriaceae bacterium]
LEAFQAAVLHSGRQARILHEEQLDEMRVDELVAQHPVLIAAAFYTATTAQLEKLRDYASAGGHLVVGIRTGYADEEARARLAVAPDVLRSVAGVHYEEFANLPDDLRVTSASLELPESARGTRWADGLLVDDAEVLVGYEHPHHGRFAAVTTKASGAGRVTYVGTVPNRALGAAVFAQILAAPVAGTWSRSPSVTVLSGVGEGGRAYFVHNWSPETAHATLPAACTDVVSGAEYASGHRVDLPAWSVVVLLAKDRGERV